MKLLFLAAGALAVGASMIPAKRTTFLLSGNLLGSLAPCGCSSPMTGGIKRRATAFKQLGGANAIILENAGLIKDGSRQSILKMEAIAEADRKANVTAINLGGVESSLGGGTALSLQGLSQRRLIASQLASDNSLGVSRWAYRGDFVIGGVSSLEGATLAQEQAQSMNQAVAELVKESESRKRFPVLMLDGDQAKAEALAAAFPQLVLIQYQSSGSSSRSPEKVGKTWLVSPGSEGKSILKLTWEGNKFSGYQVIELGPGFADEPKVSLTYKDYLGRVQREKLFENRVRTVTESFSGTATCAKCHAAEAKVWAGSSHSHALKTLELVGHQVDPDCVKCHTVGTDSIGGFESRKLTPQLANVGCESCHGAGAAHSDSPKKVHLPRLGGAACMSCHVPDHSPGFEFSTGWKKVMHGQGVQRVDK